MIKIGVGIFSFNRPNYLKQQIKSIEDASHLNSFEFHLFQDGWVSDTLGINVAKPLDCIECMQEFDLCKITNKQIHTRNQKNVGLAVNQYEGLCYLTDNYDYVMLLEDDVVLSPHWFKLSLELIPYLDKYEETIFSFSPGFRKMDNESRELDTLVSDNHHHFAEIFKSSNHVRIRPLFNQYYELVRNVEYRQRSHIEISKFFKKMGHWKSNVTGQDCGKEWAIAQNNMKRYRFCMNRAIYIGEQGEHFRPEFYKKNKFGEQKPYIFEEDKTLSELKFMKTGNIM